MTPRVPVAAIVVLLLSAPAFAVAPPDGVVAERRVFEDGAWRVERIPPEAVGAFPAVQPPSGAPDVVVGAVSHLMFQVGSCGGYEVEPLAGDVARVGGAWSLGVHSVLPPGGNGVGVDANAPVESLTTGAGHSDGSLAGVGSVRIVEDRFLLFGACILLVGRMTGTGVFAFDQTWPA